MIDHWQWIALGTLSLLGIYEEIRIIASTASRKNAKSYSKL